MEPPPAPIARISIIGAMIGQPSMRLSSTVSASPSTITPMSELVPPMSMVTTSARPARPARNWAPTTPPLGPDMTVRAGYSRAVPAGITPPFDCMT